MSNLTREECVARGIPWHDVRHRMTRRAFWHDYWRVGEYGITIHLREMEGGGVERSMLLSEVVGDVSAQTPFCLLPNLEGHNGGSFSLQIAGGIDACCGCEGDSTLSNNEGFPRTKLTDLGRLVDASLRSMGTHKLDGNVRLGRYVIMPTHIHCTLIVERDLPMRYYRGKERRATLSDVVRGFEQGCTSWWYRLLEGETVDEILANPTRGRASTDRPPLDENGTLAPGLWNPDGFNDLILYSPERRLNWVLYILRNAYFWKLHIDYPHLFEHRLHLSIAHTDYSAYGCMFLLRRLERMQVFCHRLARRNQLTTEEWQKATASWETIRTCEKYAREKKLGHFDREWYRTIDSNVITAIDYTRTEAFRKEKADILSKCENDNVVLVSPAVSAGESDIFYAALELGYPCIKLQKDVIPEKGHPVSRDRDYCAQGLLLVLGPWEIKDIKNDSVRGEDKNGLYVRFHNLNAMAAELCKEITKLSVDQKTLEECR